ncbi:MAG: glycoside hydrolase family 130 protein [Phycisphaerae bacterium]|jgi:predicted GH43/DUF377 family glycosyl hydrolase|nr:glycoside hydrolase family 130 protein [Phycisphaerae bacterium]
MKKPFELMKRYEGNPIITPDALPGANQVYNAGAVKVAGEYVLLMTVLGDEPIGRFHVARSADGVKFEVDPEPAITAQAGEDWICDPRVTFMDGMYYILYWSGSPYGCRTVLCTTKDFVAFERRGFICQPDNRNMALFPEKIDGLYARLDRPYGSIHNGAIWVSYSPDLVYWGKSRPVLNKGKFFQWDGHKVGPGAPPIRTPKGWLALCHGVREGYFGYYLSCALLDLEDPSEVLGYMRSALLSPREPYERIGAVPNALFTCGAILEESGELKIYYTGADTVICLATASIDELAEACLADGPPPKA